MTNQHRFVSSDRFDRDQYTSSKTAERVLNAAIVRAEITESFEEYLEIFDECYADDVEVSSETERAPIRGKAKVRSLLFDSRNGRTWWSFDIYSRNRDSWRYCKRDTFCVDTRLDRGIRRNLHITLVHPSEMERVARRVRASL
jgi:hypothetical protein